MLEKYYIIILVTRAQADQRRHFCDRPKSSTEKCTKYSGNLKTIAPIGAWKVKL